MVEFIRWFEAAGPIAGALLALVLSTGTAVHAVLYKRDVRSSIGWVAIIWLVPFIGGLLYLLLGINRIRRRAAALRADASRSSELSAGPPPNTLHIRDHELFQQHDGIRGLADLVGHVTHQPLTAGNAIRPLVNGDEAYPAMLEAIDRSELSVLLSTYIFDRDRWGLRFVDALTRAKARGVSVRVLVDGAGVRYSWPPITRELERRRIKVARFIPASNFLQIPFFNLRNHRKIMVVDDRLGFTGGMNIRHGHVLGDAPSHPVADVHFAIEGPVVSHLRTAFADDWAFASGEVLQATGEPVAPPAPTASGRSLARGVVDGPDDALDRIRWTWLGALACARSVIRIVTPYFLPEPSIITALNVAAMRGVRVEIILPARGNLRILEWAMRAYDWQLLDHGLRVFLTPPPFDHSKLFVVDNVWSFLGSANWDPRSLRLNFEFGIEAYDRMLANQIGQLIDQKIMRAKLLTRQDVEARSPPIKLRNGLARLLSPYL